MAVAFLSAFVITTLSVPSVAVLQGGSYKPSALLRLCNAPYLAIICAMQATFVVLHFVPFDYLWVAEVLVVGAVACYFLLQTSTLVVTLRVKRLLATLFLLNFIIAWMLPCPFVLAPVVVVLAYVLNVPLEFSICSYYLGKASKKLAQIDAVKIAVTGSFGKTSVKQILCQLLPNAMATPHSYNTPLGIAKFVNQTDFAGASYVIFEMGARRRGDIAKLCRLVKPTVGVLTGITEQHVETFKSLQGVIDTKCELLNYLGKDDLCIINGFDQIAKSCFGVGACNKKLCPNPWECYRVESLTLQGTRFTLDDGESKHLFCSPLFGVAHFQNVALCLSVALALGCSVADLQSKVASLQPVKHRLEVICSNGVTIIDDGYNANLQGVERACQSVGFLTCNKVVVSQGIVECGNDASAINSKVGQMLGDAFDVVVACGQNAPAILSGVPQGKGYLAKDLIQAVAIAKSHFDDNTICMFQNDVPTLF